ncbi:unnamed protein product [Echinostoma caproni]|uniref:Cytospin-A n=1 Tax=Echinostoma caproni TaxID=27848 RepID=A0A183A9D5_9TREM|nr:unnamed protein product [Echinostoma caproni]
MVREGKRIADSELHELRATIDALRSQTGFGLSKLWPKPQQHSNDTVGSKTNAERGKTTTGSSISLTGQTTQQPDRSDSVQPVSQSVLSSPHKGVTQSTSKESELGSKKNTGWFRTSIGKAFRKKSSTLPVVTTTAGETLATGVVNQCHLPNVPNPDHEPIANANADQTVLGDQPTTANFVQTAVSKPTNSNSGLTVSPKTTATGINGLSPSSSSTSSSCSWGASSSTNHAPGTLSPGGRTSSSATNRSTDWKLPPLSSSTGFDFGRVDELASIHGRVPDPSVSQSDGMGHEVGTLRSLSSTHSPTNSSSVHSSEPTGQLDTSGRSTWDTAQLQAELARLRSQLNERELKLTDVQLEALASTHQVNQLRDQISRLYSELQHLRSDNERLHMLVQHEATAGHRDTAAAAAEEVKEGVGESRPSRPETPTNPGEMSPCNRHCLCGSQIDLLSGLDCPVVESNRAPTSVLWSVVSIQLGSVTQCPTDGYHIGLINLKEYPTWEGLDYRLSCMWTEYVRHLDPTDRLGLRNSRLLTLRVNGTRSDRPIARNSIELDGITQLASVEGELACLVQEAQMAPQSRTVVLAQLVDPDSGHVPNSLGEWALEYLLPPGRMEQWISCLTRYRCSVFYAVVDYELLAVVRALTCHLQFTGLVTRVIHRPLEANLDDTLLWLRQQLTLPTGPVAIVLNCTNTIGIQSLCDFLAQVHCLCDDIASSTTALDQDHPVHPSVGGRKASNYILVTLSVGENDHVPPIDSVPMDGAHSRCFINASSCWIPIDAWSRAEADLRLHHGLMRQFIHQTVDKLLDEVRLNTPRSFRLMQFMSSVVQWLKEVWTHVNQFVQNLNSSGENDLIELPPTLFDHLPLADPGRCAQAFVDCWNGTIVPHLRAKFEQRRAASGSVCDGPDPRDWLVDHWPWKSVSELAKKSTELHTVITPLASTKP